jgi:hypothetical protein
MVVLAKILTFILKINLNKSMTRKCSINKQ